MALLIASDIHVAEIWDHIGDVLPRSVNYLNPNTMFRDLVRRVTTRSS